MNKEAFIEAVAAEAGISKQDARKAVDAYSKVVTDTLSKGEKIQLIGFGTYEVTERSAREGRNPKTGEAVHIAASKAPKFKASGTLKDAVNE